MDLVIEGVSKTFGGVQALRDVNAGVKGGLITALIGPNGAGKSTLLNIITGLEKADCGVISADGIKLSSLPPHKFAEKGIARTFQILQGFNELSVIENVMIGSHVYLTAGFLSSFLALPSARRENKRLRESSKEVLTSFGLEKYANRPLKELPLGLQRLTELARALAIKPKILILDEPSSGLDPQGTSALAGILKKIRDEGVSILIVEHNMRLVMKIAERVIVLNFGKIIAEGCPEEIRGNANVLKAYLGRRYENIES